MMNENRTENQEEYEKRVQRQAFAQKQYEEDLKFLLGTGQGKRFFSHILKDNFMWSTTFNKHSSVMAKNEGRREWAIDLLNDLKRLNPATVAEIINSK